MDKYVETKSQSKQWANVDTTLGVYMSPNRVWKEEGGEEEDRIPASLVVQKSIKMGPPFAVLNEGTERLDILYFSKSVKQIFTQAWTIYQNSASGAETKPPALETKPPAVDVPQSTKPRTAPLKRGALQSGSGGLMFTNF